MKKIRILFSLGLFLSSLLYITGCKKDPIIPPVAGNTTVTFTPLGEITFTGDPILIKWKVVGDYSSFTVKKNGIVVSTSPCDSILIYDVPEKLEFSAVCVLTSGNDPIVRSLAILPKGSPPPLEKPSIVVTYDTSTVPYGGSKDVSWVIKKATQATLNGVSIDTIGNKHFSDLTENTTLLFHCIGNGGEKDTTFVIHVASQMTIRQMLTHLPYRIKKSDTAAGGTSNWGNYTIPICQLDDLLIFKLDGTFERHQGIDFCIPGAPELFANGLWELLDNDTKISIGGTVYDISQITSDSLQTYISQPCSWCVNGALQRIDTYSNQ